MLQLKFRSIKSVGKVSTFDRSFSSIFYGDSISSQIHVKERSFRPVRFIRVGHIDEKKLFNPWRVAVNDLNEMIVSDMNNNRIVVLNEEGKFINSFGRGVIMHPNGLIIDNEGKIK